MIDKSNFTRHTSQFLLRESIWEIEDKLDIILEDLANHEAEIIRLKRNVKDIQNKLNLTMNNAR